MPNLQVTQVGLNAATSAEGLGLQLKLSRCRFGSAANYIPAPDGSETDLHGTTVFTAAIASYKKDIATGVLEILVRLYPTDGTFTFGEFALDAEVSPGVFVTYATAALPQLLTKYNTPTANVPSTFTFTFTLRLQQGDTTLSVIPGDVNAGGIDYASLYAELNLRIGTFNGLATFDELSSVTPPPTKGVPAHLLLSRDPGNRINLREDGLYLGDEAPSDLSIIYVDAIVGIDPTPGPDYVTDPKWFENVNKWSSIRGGPTTPFKTIDLALTVGPKGIQKTVLLKSWQVHRLTTNPLCYQSYTLGDYGSEPTGCSLNTTTGEITIATLGIDPDCDPLLIAKDEASSSASLVVTSTSPRSIVMTPDSGQTDMVLLYRNATGSLTRVHVTKLEYDGSVGTNWRYHQDTTVSAMDDYNNWALANSQPTINVLLSPEAVRGTYIGQGPAYLDDDYYTSRKILFRQQGVLLSRCIGFIASEMNPIADDSTTFIEDRFSSVLFTETQNYGFLLYNFAYYGRENPYGDWDMPGLLTMPTAGRVTSSQLIYADSTFQCTASLNNPHGRAQLSASPKKACLFFNSNVSFTLNFVGNQTAPGYVRDTGAASGYNIKDWLGPVLKHSNPVISMTTNINPDYL